MVVNAYCVCFQLLVIIFALCLCQHITYKEDWRRSSVLSGPSTAEKRELNCSTLWCKRVIRLDCRLCQRRCRPRQWPVTWFWYPINRQTAYCRRHISEVTGIVLSDRDRRLKIGSTRKPGLTGGLSRAPYAQVWRGIRGALHSLPAEKNEFEPWDDLCYTNSKPHTTYAISISRQCH